MRSIFAKIYASRSGEIVIVAGVYYIVAKICLLLALETANATSIWPPTGIALAAVLIYGCRIWPGIALGAVLANLESFAALGFTTPLILAGSFSTAIGNTLGALAGGLLVIHFAEGRNPFRRSADIVKFMLFGALLGTTVSAFIGTGALCILNGKWSDAGVVWLTWWIGDVAGVLLITPLIMTWESRRKLTWTALKITEATGGMAILFVLSWVVFFKGLDSPYFFIPILFWAAFRLGQFEAAFFILIMSSLSVAGAVNGVFIFKGATFNSSLLLLQGYISIISATTVLLSALSCERNTALADIRESNEKLQREIDLRTQVEEAMRVSEERFQLFMGHFPGLAYIKNSECRILFANTGFHILMGIDPSEIIGKTDREFLPAAIADKIAADDRHVLAANVSEEYVEFEEVFAGRTWLTRKFAIPMTNREPMLGGVTIDITGRKRAEEEKVKLEAQNRQLQKAESLGRMAGAIAHHFNNQLTAVIGNLELAKLKLTADAEIPKNLDRAMQAANRAAEVSRLMLTYLGQSPGIREPLDLSDSCRRNYSMLQAAMPKDLVLEMDLPSTGPVINANANQIQQLLMNLATNAWEAGGEGRGVIRLAVKKVCPAEIPLTNLFPIGWQRTDNDYVCLEVADAGCGIAAEDIERLFDPFYSTKFTGRGLGLSAVLGIVRVHGGAVAVESEQGRGSVFRVFFPLTGLNAPLLEGKKAQALEIAGRGTVLLVDDEEIVRNTAAELLTKLGFTAIAAKDGVEAVELFMRHKDEIRCVLCDLTMPRMDGWETLAALRKITPGIPVILASGYEESKVMTGDHPEWPQTFLGKPYHIYELRDALGRTLANLPTHVADHAVESEKWN